QIIQLFGRGVRLLGFDHRLKRSSNIDLPEGVIRPKFIEVLETLNIFGIHADYMAQFRDFLDQEGLPRNEQRVVFMLPVVRNLGLVPLRMIRLQKTINGVGTRVGDAFGDLGPIPSLRHPDVAAEPALQYLQKNQVVLNWYPRIQAMRSDGLVGG